MGTFHPKSDDIRRAWHVLDAEGIVLGRLASEAAQLLRGKHKPIFAPNVDCGDHVVIVNASKVDVSGTKREDKHYWRHSGYPGGIRGLSLGEMLDHYPERVVHTAVRGMLPKNRLGRKMLEKLHVYAGSEHPHAGQDPVPREVRGARRAAS